VYEYRLVRSDEETMDTGSWKSVATRCGYRSGGTVDMVVEGGNWKVET
jgi:hypothetical protein